MYNAEIHHRRSIRIPEYDYSLANMFFVTICVQGGEHLLGQINDNTIILNDAGRMIEEWYFEMENKFEKIECLDYVIMPNHMHFVIHNTNYTKYNTGGHIGPPLPDIICWFKSMTTNEYIKNVRTNGWEYFDGRLWQRNYYEHVIRNEGALEKIREYIKHNPFQCKNNH